MKNLSLFLALASVSAGVAVGAAIDASEITEAPITSLSVFKNGTVLVEREVKPDKPGTLFLSGDIKPYHGTFWTKSEKPLKMTAFKETVNSNYYSPTDNRTIAERHGGFPAVVWFRTDVANLESEISFLSGEAAKDYVLSVEPCQEDKGVIMKVEGVLEKLPAAKTEPTNDNGRKIITLPNPKFDGIVLRLGSGGALRIPRANIRAISAGGENQVETSVSRNLWRVEEAKEPFSFEYMTQGITWAPYYRMELGKEGKATLYMAADIKNELEDFSEAEVSLISGFPKIDMEGKDSLLNVNISLRGFLNVLESDAAKGMGGYTAQYRAKAFYSSNVMMDAGAPESAEESFGQVAQIEEKGAVNVHAQKIGKQTVKKGETLRIDIASSELEYASKARWNVTPTRNIDVRGYMNNFSTNVAQTVWDMLVFKNPFPFPLTTAPMEVTQDGTIYCQTPQSWINPGQESKTVLTKALSLEPKIEESEVTEGEVQKESFEGRVYRRSTINGKATLKNHRKEPVKAEVTIKVFGAFTKAESKAEETSSLSIPYGVDPISTKTFEYEIPAEDSLEIEYSYTSLILL